MSRDPILRAFRGVIAALVLVTLADNFLGRGASESAVDFWSYFTNQSNLIAALILLVMAALPSTSGSPRLRTWLRGGALLYLLITALVNQVVLSGGLADPILHIVAPLLLVIDWAVAPPRDYRIGIGLTVTWLAYPLVWMVYTLVRGASTGWYPYSFINVSIHGGGAVAANLLALTVFVLLLAQLVRLTGRRPSVA